MPYKRESLEKLLVFIDIISKEEGNEWFNEKLKSNLNSKSLADFNYYQINEIYEYCLEKIIKEHAEQFYRDFKLIDIKSRLIGDFVRMESFRRDDNFEDFCLAAYQQLELLVSRLIISPEFLNYFIENKDLPALLKYDSATGNFIRRGAQTIGKFIFQTGDQARINTQITAPIQGWFFNHKYRAVLYYYYFNKEINSNTDLFDRVYEIGYFLYIGRNLNHRGAVQSQYQQNVIEDLIPNQHKYYFKFLGFLEDFTTKINSNL